MTRRDLQSRIARSLAGDHAADDARVFVMRACNISHEELIRAPEEHVSLQAQWRAQRMARKRRRGMPLAYVIGERSFYGRSFIVNRHVLIPRPETELVVKTALDIAAGFDAIVDVGTGSGAIAVTLAAELQRLITATDISRAALRVAQRNARRHGVAHLVHTARGDLFVPATSGTALIVANLPYLSAAMFADSPREVRRYEPRIALVSDRRDGLEIYRQLFARAAHLSLDSYALLCEFDPRQADTIVAYAHEYFPLATVRILNDDAGHQRVLDIRLPAYRRPKQQPRMGGVEAKRASQAQWEAT